MTRVLIAGECPWVPSSVGKITFLLARGLQELGFDVSVMCPAAPVTTVSFGLVFDPARVCEHRVVPCYDGKSIWVRPQLGLGFELDRARLAGKPYDAVVIYGTPYGDPTSGLLGELREARHNSQAPRVYETPVVGYFISETLSMPPGMANQALGPDYVTAPTQFVLDSIARGMAPPEAGEWLRGNSMVVPHGLDLRVYDHSLCGRLERYTPSDRVVVGMIAKNMIRKDPYGVLRAVAYLRRWGHRRVDAALYMINAIAGAPHWDLGLAMAHVEQEMGVSLRPVHGLVGVYAESGLTEEELVRLYCSIDVFLFPTMGEAFGLPPLEAALLGRPVVATAHPALAEIWGGVIGDWLVPYTTLEHPTGFKLAKMDPLEAARRVEALVVDEGLRERVARRAMEHARRYTYEVMAREMARAIDKAIANQGAGAQILEEITK